MMKSRKKTLIEFISWRLYTVKERIYNVYILRTKLIPGQTGQTMERKMSEMNISDPEIGKGNNEHEKEAAVVVGQGDTADKDLPKEDGEEKVEIENDAVNANVGGINQFLNEFRVSFVSCMLYDYISRHLK